LTCNQTLYREVNGKVRYYRLVVYLTLFGEYLFVREYGAVKNKKPTRTIKEYFPNLLDVQSACEFFMISKLKKGYCSHNFITPVNGIIT